MGTISYDEYENGLPFLFTLPVSRKEYVKEKFLLGFLTGGAGFLVSSVVTTVMQWVKTPEMEFLQWFLFCGCFLIFLAIFLGLMIPIQLKYGSDKGKIVFLGTFLILIALFYLITNISEKLSLDLGGVKQFLTGISDGQFFVGGILLAVVVLYI